MKDISHDKKLTEKSYGRKKKEHPCPWPFPSQLLQYSRANPPPLNESNQKSSGRQARSKRATPTFADMMTDVGDAPW